jgi:hypothetical protein
MTPYEKIKPKYVQNWFNNRLKAFLKYTELNNDKNAKNPEYEAKKEDIKKNSEGWRFTSKKYLTDREQKEENELRRLEIEREKLRALISLDNKYKETVPFADYFPFPDVSTRSTTTLTKRTNIGSGNSSRSQTQLKKVEEVDAYDYDIDPHSDIKGKKLSMNTGKGSFYG